MRQRLQPLAVVACTLAAAGCGKAPPAVPSVPAAPPPVTLTIAAPVEAKVKASLTLTAAADVNPDGSGRPSPVVVRVYQLRTDGGFKSAEFAAIYDDDKGVLGAELISRDEYVLTPSEQRTIEVTFAGETRFVGVLAAFRDIRGAQWRAVTATPSKGVAVGIERTRVVMAVSQ